MTDKSTETACLLRADLRHCQCWYDGEGQCCACAEPLPHIYVKPPDGSMRDFYGECYSCGRDFSHPIHIEYPEQSDSSNAKEG